MMEKVDAVVMRCLVKRFLGMLGLQYEERKENGWDIIVVSKDGDFNGDMVEWLFNEDLGRVDVR